MRETLPIYTPIDARALGALCDTCPLNGGIPVKPRTNKRPELVMIGEGPGGNEEIFGEPFVGESGRTMDAINERVGGARAALHITNAMLCKPSRKLQPEEWRKAIECCKPRLRRELAELRPRGAKVILALGGRAQQSLTGKAKIMDWMGAPLVCNQDEFPGWSVISALHPAFALRGKPEWFPVIAIHAQRAWRLARGELPKFIWPEIVTGSFEPHIIKALKRLKKAKKLACDVETAGLDPQDALLNVGFGSVELNLAVSVHWQEASDTVRKLVKELLEDKKIRKVFHNGQFDIIVLEQNNV